jgi:DNA-binding XRE family transcriptional regulator
MTRRIRKINLSSEKRIEEVSLSMDGKRLIFVFENGEGYSIPRKNLPGDDGSPIAAIEIFDHRGAVLIRQASGEAYDLPWDSVKHYGHGGRQKKFKVGDQLKKIRQERGFSQKSLAQAAGISRMQLTRLERNISTPQLDTLLNLSRVLGISPREWVG